MSRYAQITANAVRAMTDASTTESTPCADTSSPRNFMVILGIGRTFPFKKEMKVLLAASQCGEECLLGQPVD